METQQSNIILQDKMAKPLEAVDKIITITSQNIISQKTIAADEFYFKGHYPDYPIYPGIFMVESTIQTARFYCRHFGYVANLQNCSNRFLQKIVPGDSITINCKVIQRTDSNIIKFKARVLKDDIHAASVSLLFAVKGAQ